MASRCSLFEGATGAASACKNSIVFGEKENQLSEKITFSGVQLLGFSRDSHGGKATFSSTFGSSVMSKMGWIEIPECLTGGSLEGELAATSLELVPKEAELKRHQMQLDITRVSKFLTVRLELEGKQGKGHRTELRFTAYFADPKGARKLEEYMLTCSKSSLVVSYEKQAQQADLPGVEVRDDGQQDISGIQ